MWVQGLKDLGHPLLLSQATAESWIGRGVAGTRTGTHMGCRCFGPGFTLSSHPVVPSLQVSQAAAELQQYCMQNACKDALLVGVPAGSNPFREPRSCALL
uniref:Guanine nucleotide-binding protein subunit gamma n=1 Tax=Oryctolagus cuniculus TaxID=9986 RepID=A0A5F9CXU7_RABIT